MTRDFQIDIARDPKGYRLTLRGPELPQAGCPLQTRQAVGLSQDDFNELRRGNPSAKLCTTVKDSISTWLFDAALEMAIQTAIAGNGKPPIRLVWNLDSMVRPEFADLPVEVAHRPMLAGPFVLENQVAGVVHLLPKVGVPGPAIASRNWPFRVLMVRSNPPDRGGGVPAALPLRDEILNLRPELQPAHLLIDVLSAENGPGVKSPATRRGLAEALKRLPSYDLLVYLGHGDIVIGQPGVEPVGVLLLETDDGLSHDPVPSPEIAAALVRHAVPVVVLVACMSALDPGHKAYDDCQKSLPNWVRGIQGVAQALVNSESGVQTAIGMRSRMDVADAELFVRIFFESLLQKHPGNVEAAVKEARASLHLQHTCPFAYAAPVLFSALQPEPVFGFLASLPVGPSIEKQLTYRSSFWRMLANLPMAGREPEATADILALMNELDQEIIDIVTASVPLLMPSRLELLSESNGEATLGLFGGPVNANRVFGKVGLDGGGAKLTGIIAGPAALAAGWQVLLATDDGKTTFQLQRARPDAGPLPDGTVLLLKIASSAASRICSTITIEGVQCDPPMPIRTAGNGVIIASP